MTRHSRKLVPFLFGLAGSCACTEAPTARRQRASDAELTVQQEPLQPLPESVGQDFHDGSAATLEQAVGKMAKYQLGQNLDANAVSQIVAFLKTLTGRTLELAPEQGLVAERPKP